MSTVAASTKAHSAVTTVAEGAAAVAIIALARLGVFGKVRRHTGILDNLPYHVLQPLPQELT